MINNDQVLALAEETGFPRISLFMPTHRTGAELRQGPIRLKNLLREASQRLETRGLSRDEINALLADARKYTESEADPFWQHRDHGLAVFISSEGTRYISAPVTFDEHVKVGQRYLVKPFLPLLMRDSRFYLLEASLDKVVLHGATRFAMSPVQDDRLAIVTLPAGTQDVLVQETSRQEANSASPPSKNDVMPSDLPEEVRKFGAAVAKAVDAVLADAHEPLVIAADDRLLGMLRNDIRYRGLVEDGIREHPRALDDDKLHARAYELVRERLDADRQAAIERFEGRQGSGEGASDRIQEVLPAAVQGRVEALIVSVDARIPGLYVSETSNAVVAQDETDETIDLVDYAVLQTLRNGGAVYSHPVDRADALPQVAAIFRY
jgi:protein required for attachment to host cells